MLMTASPATASDIRVALPLHLRHLGEATLARVSGNPDGPPIVLLGGISADRFVASGRDGGAGWWPGMVGPGCAVDPALHRILGLDFAADESGAAAPSMAEQAEILCAALDAAGVEKAAAIIGASYGGMVALRLAQDRPERVEKLVIISAPGEPHPSSTAIRELQRRVVALGVANGAAEEGLSIARGMAMLTYRSREEFAGRFTGGISGPDPLLISEAGAYLRARGDAYKSVMSPGRFLSLSASIDRHEVDPAGITVPVLLIGASSDQLVPAGQMEALADDLPDARLHLLDCLYGHDMFLKEAEKVAALVRPFLEDA
jgi:homoserine O-acetyltransferase